MSKYSRIQFPERLLVPLTTELKEKVKSFSAQNKMSMADVFRKSVEWYLKFREEIQHEIK